MCQMKSKFVVSTKSAGSRPLPTIAKEKKRVLRRIDVSERGVVIRMRTMRGVLNCESREEICKYKRWLLWTNTAGSKSDSFEGWTTISEGNLRKRTSAKDSFLWHWNEQKKKDWDYTCTRHRCWESGGRKDDTRSDAYNHPHTCPARHCGWLLQTTITSSSFLQKRQRKRKLKS